MNPRPLHVAEPPVHYRLRPPLVVDCSVVAGSVFNEDWQDQADQQIAHRELHAPYLLQFEIANVALKKSLKGFDQVAADGLAQFGAMAMHLHRIEEAPVVALALRYRLTAYDAAYLWLAADLKCALATFDTSLAEAARQHLASLP